MQRYGWICMGLLVLLLAGAGARAQVPAPPQPAADAAQAGTASPEPDSTVNWRRSLMFSETDIANLRRVMEAYEAKLRSGGFEQQAGQDDYLTEILGAADQENGKAAYRAPSFYLGSIVVYGDGRWAAWIGQEKITSEDNGSERPLHVEKIDKRALAVAWRPGSQWPRVQTFWEQRNAGTDEPSNYLASGSRTVTVDEQEQVVRFLLRPNQIFYAGTMEIYEGRTVPALIEAAFNARFAKLLRAPQAADESLLPAKTPVEEEGEEGSAGATPAAAPDAAPSLPAPPDDRGALPAASHP